MCRRRQLVVATAVALLVVVLPVAPSPAGAASPRPGNFATSGDLVDWAYQRLLGRSPDRVGLAGWTRVVDGPGGDPAALLDGLAHSGEYDAWVGPLIRAYRTAYGRGPDLGGLRGWLVLRAVAGGQSFRQYALAGFLGGSEYRSHYDGTTDTEFVRRVYRNALGREAESAGLNAWTAHVRTVGRAQVLFEISESAEHRSRRRSEVEITGAYAALLGRLPDGAGFAGWSNFLASGGSTRNLYAGIWGSPELAGRLATVPTLAVEVLVPGLTIPWGLAFTPDGTLLFTQRGGGISARLGNGTVQTVAADLGDLFVGSEGGLLDIAVDPGFATNRRFYTCMNRRTAGGAALDVAVVAWTMGAGGYTSATRAADLVTGIPLTSGRHTGCRIVPDPATPGVLYVGTGDAAVGTHPQSLTSLGGKVLRISSTTGAGVAGNPFIGSANADARRIYNIGHRNIQGLAVRPGTTQLWTAEHGTDRDDEINVVLPGANYGWDPVPGYDESRPMTDLARFPGAVPAAWSSGFPTVAPSGMTFLVGCGWGAWADHAAVALLKGSELRIHGFNRTGLDLGFAVAAELDGTYGRLRTAVQGPDGSLYLTTSNGGGADRILRVTPSGGRCAAPP